MPMANHPIQDGPYRYDCLKPLGLSVTEARTSSASAASSCLKVVNGYSGISPEMAIRLDKASGAGASTWYRLQAAYDSAQAMKRADRIKVARISTVA